MFFRDRDMSYPYRAGILAIVFILLTISSIERIFAQESESKEHKIDSVMDGDLDEIIDALATADQAEKLKQAK